MQTSNILGGEIVQLVKTLGRDHHDRLTNLITAIAFSCAAIHFPTVYNIQHHQSPVTLMSCLYGVAG